MHTHLHVHTVPSGHILTRDELNILRSLLASYSNEKIQSIQLSLQEKQKIRDISREEVEKSLRQGGLDSMADGLKHNLERGTVKRHFYARDKFMQICENRPLDKIYAIFIYAL